MTEHTLTARYIPAWHCWAITCSVCGLMTKADSRAGGFMDADTMHQTQEQETQT